MALNSETPLWWRNQTELLDGSSSEEITGTGRHKLSEMESCFSVPLLEGGLHAGHHEVYTRSSLKGLKSDVAGAVQEVYTSIVRIGRTSMKIHVEAWRGAS